MLGAEFLRFDAALPPSLRGRVVLALAAADIVADASAFAFARGFTRARGYRVMLRGATPALLEVLSAPALGMDYFALPWEPDLPRLGRCHAGHAAPPQAWCWIAATSGTRWPGAARPACNCSPAR